MVRAFAWNDSQEIRGWAGFSKNAVPIQNVALSKEPVRFGDSIFITCSFAPADSLSNTAMYCMYAMAQEQTSTLNYTGASMIETSSGLFTSPPFSLIFSGQTGDILFVKFRVSYTQGGARTADTSQIYSFNILGCPDLVFTTDSLLPVWYNDSIRINFGSSTPVTRRAPLFRRYFM